MPCTLHPELATVPARQIDLVQARSVHGFRFTESKHHDFIPSHTHQHATVTVLLSGTFEESYELSRMSCESHSVLFRPAGEAHADRFGREGAHIFVIEIDKERADVLGEQASILHEVAHLRDARLMQLVWQMRSEVEMPDEASSLALEGIAMAFIAHSMRVSLGAQNRTYALPWLQRSEELLRDRFREGGILLRELAEEVGIHPVHFARAFKAHYGTSPGRYLRTLRIEWAATQLSTSNQSIADIALAAGFADQSHFGKVFKQQYGMSPGSWRRQHRA